MKTRVWTIDIEGGTFRFLADSKELAIDHAWCLKIDPDFPRVLSTPRMIGWAEDVPGLDLDEIEVTIG